MRPTIFLYNTVWQKEPIALSSLHLVGRDLLQKWIIGNQRINTVRAQPTALRDRDEVVRATVYEALVSLDVHLGQVP